MADIEFQWLKTEQPIRISEYANDLGYNLRNLDYSGVSSDVWVQIDKKIRNRILSDLDEHWENNELSERSLSKVTQGLYVITLSDNLSIDYNGRPSKVLYIGRGKIRERIQCHLKMWLRYLSDSLQDIALDIWMAEVRVNGNKNAYKEVEADLLNDFLNKFGCHPLQNEKAGDNHEKLHDYCKGWNKPLHNLSNIQDGWSIKPLNNNPWAMEFDENA